MYQVLLDFHLSQHNSTVFSSFYHLYPFSQILNMLIYYNIILALLLPHILVLCISVIPPATLAGIAKYLCFACCFVFTVQVVRTMVTNTTAAGEYIFMPFHESSLSNSLLCSFVPFVPTFQFQFYTLIMHLDI